MNKQRRKYNKIEKKENELKTNTKTNFLNKSHRSKKKI